ncbi:unnamed protein product, partial [Clonostachys chloroleuca]
TSDFNKSTPVLLYNIPYNIIILSLLTALLIDLIELDYLYSSRGLKVKIVKILADELASIYNQSTILFPIRSDYRYRDPEQLI